MFEKYTEAAKRSIFFARYEAAQLGNRSIDPYHLLLGTLREHPLLRARVLGTATLDDLRAEFAHFGGLSKIPTSVDLPLSAAGKRVLAFAAEEAKMADSPVIDGGHLLAGLLHDRTPASEALEKRGITLAIVQQEILGGAPVEAALSVEAILATLDAERLPAAIRILEALGSRQVRITVATDTDQFTVSFPPLPGA